MSATLLREAATEMRERAQAATPGRWDMCDFNEGDGFPPRPLWGVANAEFFNPSPDEDEPWLAIEVHTGSEEDAAHIASWHPAVAFAVADWLTATARELDALNNPSLDGHPLDGRRTAALSVARAYLGRDS